MACRSFTSRQGRLTFLTTLWLTGVAAVCVACGPQLRCEPAPKDVAWEHALQDAFRERRFDDLLALWRQRQRTGDPETMWAMGLYIGIGFGEFPSLRERNHTALRLTKRAALCGFPHAVNFLRVNYERGDLARIIHDPA